MNQKKTEEKPMNRRAWIQQISAALLLPLLVVNGPANAQAPEGYDPLRQIGAQLVPANLLVTLDRSGSMALDKYGNGFERGPGPDNQFFAGTDQWGSIRTGADGGRYFFTGVPYGAPLVDIPTIGGLAPVLDNPPNLAIAGAAPVIRGENSTGLLRWKAPEPVGCPFNGGGLTGIYYGPSTGVPTNGTTPNSTNPNWKILNDGTLSRGPTAVYHVRTDPQVNFSWTWAAPPPGNVATKGGTNAQYFSVRWVGEIEAQQSEMYTFYGGSDDGITVWLNGERIVNYWGPRSYGTGLESFSREIFLPACSRNQIVVEYFQQTGGARVTLKWKSPSNHGASGEPVLVPQKALYPGTVSEATVTPTAVPTKTPIPTSTPVPTATPYYTPTKTPIPATATPKPPTKTPTPIPPTRTPGPSPTPTPIPPTATPKPPTSTPKPATNTPTPKPPTKTPIPPTATPIPPTPTATKTPTPKPVSIGELQAPYHHVEEPARYAALDPTRFGLQRPVLPRLPHIAAFVPIPTPPICPTATPAAGPPPAPTSTNTPTPTPIISAPPREPATTKAQKWRYTLRFDPPSRIATMKNALGSSVAIVSGYRPPRFDAANLSALAPEWQGRTVRIKPQLDVNTWANPFKGDKGPIDPVTGQPTWTEPDTLDVTEINPACTYTGPALAFWDPKNPDGNLPVGSTGTTAGCTTWVYELDNGAGTAGSDPGPPFEAFSNWANRKPGPATGTWEDPKKVVWQEGSGGIWKGSLPANIIGDSTSKVNWGLLAFSSTELGIGNQCNYQLSLNNLLLSAIKPEGGDDGRRILDQMRLQSDGGLEVGGGTPTRTALDKAQQLIIDTFAADEKYQCLRTYGVILVTDGESNLCNEGTPANGPWSGNDVACPGAYTLFPASVADDIWNLALKTPCVGKTPRDAGQGVINPRTWVIGFGGDVGKCELNYTAFMGRTDASSPNPDAGFAWTKDPRLCSTGDPATCAPNTATYLGNYKDTADYAFFADETDGLVDAFDSIINATATGDYSTSAPIAGGAIGQGEIVLLASTEFPRWEGHIYRINTTAVPGTVEYREWDAAVKLNERCEVAPCTNPSDTPKPRRIYTWDPTTTTLDLVPVTSDATTVTKLRGIEAAVTGSATLTANIVDFVRGNDGTLTNRPREARLGPLINTTPALVGGPAFYKQGNLTDHKGFESEYSSRRPMMWIGSNDGMLHAFDYFTGEEVVAILPPQLLAAQSKLYEGFTRILDGKLNPTSSTGQPKALGNHIYGVANSIRFGDIYFPSVGYRTVAFLTLGPGGDVLTALDITHPFPGDPAATVPIPADKNFGVFPGLPVGAPADLPVQVIWSKTGAFSGSTLSSNYYASWSIPALGAHYEEADKFSIVFGNGHNPASRRSTSVAPHAFVLDPVDGTERDPNLTVSTVLLNGSNPWVGNQTFADAVVFDNKASDYRSDNQVRTGLQADLNGRVWYIPLEMTEKIGDRDILIDASSKAKQSQPIYYPPAAGGFGSSKTCNVYALGSGSFYEKSTLVSGLSVGTAGSFIPSLFIASNDQSKYRATIPDTRVIQIPINTIKTPDGSALLDPQTQLTAPPFMLIDPKGVAPTTAIFVVYDPTKGCNGNAYVVAVKFEVSGCAISSQAVTTYDAGAGASSGGTIAGGEYYVAKSGVGEGQQADLYKPPDIKSALGGGKIFRPVWWKELK